MKHDKLSYRQAITTTYKCNNKGQQYLSAKCEAKTIQVNWNYDLDTAKNHAEAAQVLMDKMEWPEKIIGGSIHNGATYAWVLIPRGRVIK